MIWWQTEQAGMGPGWECSFRAGVGAETGGSEGGRLPIVEDAPVAGDAGEGDMAGAEAESAGFGLLCCM